MMYEIKYLNRRLYKREPISPRQMTNTWSWNPFGDENIQTNLDIEVLKNEVGKHFPFYEVKFNMDTAAFFCRIDKDTLEEKFDSLRKSLKEKGYKSAY